MRSAVCLIVKNELCDIAEWIIHHSNIGFDVVIIYDNQSDDGTRGIITDLSKFIPIRYNYWPTMSVHNQIAAYEDCLIRYKHDFDWIMFADADEFLIPVTGESLSDLLDRFHDHAAVVVNWLIFGTSGVRDLEGGLVMEALTRRSRLDFAVNRHYKSIVRPAKVVQVVNPHTFIVTGTTVDLNGKTLEAEAPGLIAQGQAVHGTWRLHHYFIRTLAHWQKRLQRGQLGRVPRRDEQFESYDRCEEIDVTALPYALRVRQLMAKHDVQSLISRNRARTLAETAPPTVVEGSADQKPLNVLCVLDEISAVKIHGWAFDRNNIHKPVVLTCRVDGCEISRATCNNLRADLKASNYPERSGYFFVLPERYIDGSQHRLQLSCDGNPIKFHRKGKLVGSVEFVLLSRLQPVLD